MSNLTGLLLLFMVVAIPVSAGYLLSKLLEHKTND